VVSSEKRKGNRLDQYPQRVIPVCGGLKKIMRERYKPMKKKQVSIADTNIWFLNGRGENVKKKNNIIIIAQKDA